MNDDYLSGIEECAEYAWKEIEKVMENHIVIEQGPLTPGKCELILSVPDILTLYKALNELSSKLDNIAIKLHDRRSKQFSDFVGSLRIHDEKLESKAEVEESQPVTGGL